LLARQDLANCDIAYGLLSVAKKKRRYIWRIVGDTNYTSAVVFRVYIVQVRVATVGLLNVNRRMGRTM